MSVTAFIRRCLDAGMPMDMALTAAEAFEEEAPVFVPPTKSTGAERTRRWRENKGKTVTSVTVTSQTVTSVTDKDLPLSVSPTPPSTNPNQITPLNPPASQAAEPDLKAVSEEIWQLQPIVGGKRRSTRPDVLKALRAAVERRGHDAGRIVAALRAYYRLPDCRKDGGQFASGAAVILAEDRWRDFEPTPGRERPPPKADPAVQANRIRHFHDTGEWKPAWGPPPPLEKVA